jgi:hypothetical protein
VSVVAYAKTAFESRTAYTGYGYEKGGLTAHIRNPGNRPLTAIYHELLPSQLQVALSEPL